MTTALAVRDVHVTLRDSPVLAGLDLVVGEGQCRALVGLNGAGKTTALRVLLGMLRPDRGSVRIAGQDIAASSRTVWRGVGHLVESPFSYPELTARENVVAAARLHGSGVRDAEAELRDLAEALRLATWLDVPVRRLSLGTRQKVGLAAAFVHRPDLVVLDEPTNALDPLAVVGLRDLIARTVGRGAAVLVTSHHFDELARVAHRVDVLHRGRVIETVDGGVADLEQRFFDLVLAAERDVTAADTPAGSGRGTR